MDYREEARQLVRGLTQRMSPSSYDTAWLARLNGCRGGARWPDLVDWLLEHQHSDGSWGGAIEYHHDRIICTLASIISLYENGADGRAAQAIERGERCIWQSAQRLSRDPFELSGFELVFPTLLGEAQELGLDVPGHAFGYGKIQTEKLRLIPPELLYSPHISTVYSLEFLGRSADVDRLRRTVGKNGSVGNSPATTAYYCLLSQDEAALAYLTGVKEQGRIVTVYPFRVFELGWVLYNLLLTGLPLDEFVERDRLETLYQQLGPQGLALDATFGVTDGDITSVCCAVLLRAGYDVDPAVLAHFQDEESLIFHTYGYERNVSVSTNVHALDALGLLPEYPRRAEVKEQVIIALLNDREYNTYWTDKWHASPYYPTAQALVALLGEGPHMVYACRSTIDWLTHAQRADGSWGFYGAGTAEETAYALIALVHCAQHDAVDADVLHRGAAYLARAHEEGSSTYPELWLAKSIYSPYDIVRSAILSALMLYEESFGRRG